METANSLRKSLPRGTRLVLVDDLPNEPGMPAGLKGTVDFIDDACNIHMKWDNGRTLSLTVDDNWRMA